MTKIQTNRALLTSTRPALGLGHSFDPSRQDRLEMRRLFLARHDANLDFFETRLFEPAVQIAFGKTQPAIPINLARLPEIVLEEVEHHDLAAAAQHPER